MAVSFIKSGQKVYVEKVPEGVRASKLKPSIYTLDYTREEGYFLVELIDAYELPEKLYGDHEKAAIRVISTHFSKNGNTGVLLTGLKGTGKSLFVKVISNILIKNGLPVIQINKPYNGEDIFNIIENIGPCALVFDEFGKNYNVYHGSNAPTQSGLLSLLDGMSNSKRIHLFTENRIESISEYLLNRPGRVHYHFKYDRLPIETIKELCKDSDIPDDVTEEMVTLSHTLKILSFDIVKCLLNEWKMYGGSLTEHLKILNISLLNDPNSPKIEILKCISSKGKELDVKSLRLDECNDRITITQITGGDIYITFNLSDATFIDGNIYSFLINTGEKIIIKINSLIYRN